MSNVKGKGQRLIPEELLKYLEALKNKYPDAVDLVEANPTLEGGEDSLSSVLIKGTKYAVGGGSEIHLYEHVIRIKSTFSGEKYVLTSVIINSSTPFTNSSFIEWLSQNHSSDETSLFANGTDNILGIYSYQDSAIFETKGSTFTNLGTASNLILVDTIRTIL